MTLGCTLLCTRRHVIEAEIWRWRLGVSLCCCQHMVVAAKQGCVKGSTAASAQGR